MSLIPMIFSYMEPLNRQYSILPKFYRYLCECTIIMFEDNKILSLN